MPLEPPKPVYIAQSKPLQKGRRDTFKSLASLKQSLTEGHDYSISVVDRDSPVTVVSPHGGKIEPGTSELARALAKQGFNLFDFQALSNTAARMGHVTSTNFRDRRLTSLLNKSTVCVSFHRMRDRHQIIYLGGANRRLKEIAARALKEAGFRCTTDPPRLKGLDPENFVNLAQDKGLQVEIPVLVADSLIPDIDSRARLSSPYELQKKRSLRFSDFVEAINSSLALYFAEHNQSP